MAELLRTLEVTINRRLDGVLHGNHQGLTPGHGSEPGEARLYQPGDDVRRIDWNVTARTRETHIRESDRRPRPRSVAGRRHVGGDAVRHRARTARPRSRWRRRRPSASSPPATRTGSAPCWSPGRNCTWSHPAGGRTQVQAILSKIAAPPPSEGRGRADLAGAIDRVGALSKRRGFVAVIADFVGSAWVDPLARLGLAPRSAGGHGVRPAANATSPRSGSSRWSTRPREALARCGSRRPSSVDSPSSRPREPMNGAPACGVPAVS